MGVERICIIITVQDALDLYLVCWNDLVNLV